MNIYSGKRRKLIMYVRGEEGERIEEREKSVEESMRKYGGKVREKRSHFTIVNFGKKLKFFLCKVLLKKYSQW